MSSTPRLVAALVADVVIAAAAGMLLVAPFLAQ